MKSIFLYTVLVAVVAGGCSKTATDAAPAPAKVDAPAAPALSAKFSVTNTINDDGVGEGDDVKLENQSVSAVSYLWDFGNGTSSTEKSPVVQFSCGMKSVTLTVTGADGGSKSITKDLLVYCKGKPAGNNADGQPHTGNTGH